VEVMVATVLLSLIIVSILSALIGAYRVAAKARFNDHARYVIKSFSDQFLTQATTDINGNTLTMFQVTVDPNPGPNLGHQCALGTGLSWTNYDGSGGSPTAGNYGYNVILGDNTGSNAPITAVVSRSVWYLYSSTGAETLLPQNQSAGYLLEGTFTITFTLWGNTVTQSITNVRAYP
jgi:type II secretory pathway pseudopilin PulG